LVKTENARLGKSIIRIVHGRPPVWQKRGFSTRFIAIIALDSPWVLFVSYVFSIFGGQFRKKIENQHFIKTDLPNLRSMQTSFQFDGQIGMECLLCGFVMYYITFYLVT
jgi:hypothetical protein